MFGRTNGKRRGRAANPAAVFETVESRVLLSTNVPVGAPLQVNEFTTGGQVVGFNASRSIASDASGNYAVVWGSMAQGAVMARLFSADGTPRTGEFRVNSAVMGTSTSPVSEHAVAMDADGDFVVAWEQEVRSGNRVVGTRVTAQRFDAAGNRRGGELVQRGRFPSVAMDDAGNFVVTYTSSESNKDPEGIYARRYDAAGNVLPTPYASTGTTAGEFRVNTFSTGQQRDAAVAMDANGDFVVSWQSLNQDGDGWGVYAQPFDASGARKGSELRVNQATALDQKQPSVSADAEGNFVVAWRDSPKVASNPEPPNDLYFRRFNASGAPLSGETVANTTGSNHNYPNVAVNRQTGAFVLTWTGNRNGYAFDSGHLRQYDAAGNPEGDPIDPGGSSTHVAWQPGGKFVAAFDNPDAHGGGVYVQRYSQLRMRRRP